MRRRILVADDSPTIRRLVKQTFDDAEFEVIEVSNGDAAIKSLDEVTPDVVLADIYMPGKNGYQVCSYIRSQPRLAQIPVVLLFGAFDAFDEESASRAGATANVTKPFEPGALVDLVKSILIPETEATSRPEEQVSPFVDPTAPAVDEPPDSVQAESHEEVEDILGLNTLFKEPQSSRTAGLTDEEIDKIADRVIQRISAEAIANIAWDVVPDIAEKIVREELKRSR
jgi:CheY-like chemotaxis protein